MKVAQKLNTYEFPRRRNKYDWGLWLNGSIWRLRKGEDFTKSVETMRAQAYNMAVKRGMKLDSVVEDENTLVIRAVVS